MVRSLLGAAAAFLLLAGPAQAAVPPLGGASYLVVHQTAVVPGASSRHVGLVGIRVHVGDPLLGLPVGSELLIGLPAAQESAKTAARRTSPPATWAMLGFASSPGHAA